MVDSRNKGASFERWLCDQLFTELSLSEKPKRNLDQYQTKGECDIIIGCLAIEAKRYAKGHWYKPEWWAQAVHSAGTQMLPVLAYKYDRLPVRWVMPASMIGAQLPPEIATIPVSLDWEDGLAMIKRFMEKEDE